MSVQKPQIQNIPVENRSTTPSPVARFEEARAQAEFSETSYGNATPSSLHGSPATEKRFAVTMWCENPADLLKRDTD